MADSFKLTGSIVTEPLSGIGSADAELSAPLDEALSLKRKSLVEMELTADSPAAVSFGGVVNAHLLIVKVLVGSEIRLRLTSAKGALQAIPVDGFIILFSGTTPITAIDVTRTAGVATTVEIVLGEKN